MERSPFTPTPSKSITKTPSSSVSPGIPKKIYECKNGSCTYVATVMAPPEEEKREPLLTFFDYLRMNYSLNDIVEIKNHIRNNFISFDFESQNTEKCWKAFLQKPTFQDNISFFKKQKSPEKPVDTNYTGKSVLSYLLQLDFDLLIQVVETVQWKKVLFQVAFSLRDAVNKVLEFTSHEWKMRDILINKANLPPKETPSQPLFYEEDIVTPIIK